MNQAFRQKQERFDCLKSGKTSVLEWLGMKLQLSDFHQLRPALAGRFQNSPILQGPADRFTTESAIYHTRS